MSAVLYRSAAFAGCTVHVQNEKSVFIRSSLYGPVSHVARHDLQGRLHTRQSSRGTSAIPWTSADTALPPSLLFRIGSATASHEADVYFTRGCANCLTPPPPLTLNAIEEDLRPWWMVAAATFQRWCSMMHDENKWYFAVGLAAWRVWFRVQPPRRRRRSESERRCWTQRGSGIWLDRECCD